MKCPKCNKPITVTYLEEGLNETGKLMRSTYYHHRCKATDIKITMEEVIK